MIKSRSFRTSKIKKVERDFSFLIFEFPENQSFSSIAQEFEKKSTNKPALAGGYKRDFIYFYATQLFSLESMAISKSPLALFYPM